MNPKKNILIKKKLIEYNKKLIEYINQFNKSEKLSDYKDVREILGEYKDRGIRLKSYDIGMMTYQEFFTNVDELIVLYNYTGNLYKFNLSLVIQNDCFNLNEETECYDEEWDYFDKKIDFFKLSLKDMSNLLSLFIFQRFTRILGTEVIFFSLKKMKYKKEKVYFTYEGYFVVSKWYTETEKNKIITSIYSIISNINSFFDDIKFNFQEINIKDFKKSLKKSSKNWKVDFIYWFFLSEPNGGYKLDNDYNYRDILLGKSDLLMSITNKDCRFNVFSRYYGCSWYGKSIVEQWDNFLSNNLTDYNSLKKSALILNILDEGRENELETIFRKYDLRLSCWQEYGDLYYGCSYKNDYKSNYFIKMYIIYFRQNSLYIGWNGIYKKNKITKNKYYTKKLNYYCSFYTMYQTKYYIKRRINEIYNFNYLDEKYTNFTLIDFLKCRKQLPRLPAQIIFMYNSAMYRLFMKTKGTFETDNYRYKKKKKAMEEDDKNESISFAKNPLKAIKLYKNESLMYQIILKKINQILKKKKKE